MNSVRHSPLISQAEYIKKLRLLMPAQAFVPTHHTLHILLVNLIILILGVGIASYLSQWNPYFWVGFLPLSLIMGNSIVVALFSTHDLLHAKAIKNPRVRYLLSFLGLAMLWMPPTLWKSVHNQEHHNKTNSINDPDRNYLATQPTTWGKWIQHQFVPSRDVNPIFLVIGMAHAWSIHALRNLTSVVFFNDGLANYPPAAFQVTKRKRRTITLEWGLLIALHFSIIAYLDFNPVQLLLGYFLPIWIGHSVVMLYVYTNHMMCQLTEVNDPLVNSVSLKVPRIFDLLHLNFSYHTEHHVFPNMNPDYYPLLRKILQQEYPGRLNLLEAKQAWKILLKTPRHYQDDTTFVDWFGNQAVPCPLTKMDKL
ncbi:MAG: fatty acid desaturase family protein [Leptolyngbyaceae cyanobacterium]